MTHLVLDRPEILEILFPSKRDERFDPLDPNTRSVAIEMEPGLFVRGRLYPATPDSPAILYFHGNTEIAADYDAFADFYTQLLGITLLVIDYRGCGASDGTPTATNFLSDALKIFLATDSIFRENKLTPKQTFVLGRSLGSAAAIEIAMHARDKISGLIVESGFAETLPLLARFGLCPVDFNEERDGFGNALKISRIIAPTLILHGKEDLLISNEQAQKLYRCSAATNKQLVLIPKAGHNNLMIVGVSKGKSPYFEAIRKLVGLPDRKYKSKAYI